MTEPQGTLTFGDERSRGFSHKRRKGAVARWEENPESMRVTEARRTKLLKVGRGFN